MQAQDPMLFYAIQVDEENRMANFFWRDGLSKFNYDCFGDVVTFDTTYRTNKYNMICAPFVGVNNHWKNVFFGCAFLTDETTGSFVCLFESFLEAMGNKAPKTIFTDQDHAMANAVAKVFPNSCHRLCEWHIAKNATQNIPHLYGKSEFRDKYFTKLLHGCESEMEFESTWKEMIEEWEVSENTWLKKLYSLRAKWCPTFSLETFSAGIRSTQRSESTNNVFHQMACKTMSLTEFVIHYEEQVTRMREIELQDDFSCARGNPKVSVSGNGILRHASIMYTHVIFRIFQGEFLQGMFERIINSTNDWPLISYTLQSESGKRKHVVGLDSRNNSIVCSCKLFESKGWLCRHALRVYNVETNVQEIPSQYLLKSWSKGAKEDIVMDEFGEMIPKVVKSSKIMNLNKLMRKCFNIMSLCADENETVDLANTYLDRLAEEAKRSRRGNDSSAVIVDASNGNLCFDNAEVVKDPIRKWPKGVSYGRIKGGLEKRKRKPSNGTSMKTSQRTSVTLSGPSQRYHDITQPVPSMASPVLNEIGHSVPLYLNRGGETSNITQPVLNEIGHSVPLYLNRGGETSNITQPVPVFPVRDEMLGSSNVPFTDLFGSSNMPYTNLLNQFYLRLDSNENGNTPADAREQTNK